LKAAGQGGLILDIPTGIAIATVGLIA